jgi:hypothetical protein
MMMMMECMTSRGMMFTRVRMSWTMLYYLNDDNRKHDYYKDDDDKRADDLDNALLP